MKNRSQKNFLHQLEKVTAGLVYVSEIDSAVEPFRLTENAVKERDTFERLAKAVSSNSNDEEFQKFFKGLTTIKDWYQEKEKKKASQYLKLKRLLENSLTGLSVIRIGRIQIDIYVLGKDAKGNILGVRTKAVET